MADHSSRRPGRARCFTKLSRAVTRISVAVAVAVGGVGAAVSRADAVRSEPAVTPKTKPPSGPAVPTTKPVPPTTKASSPGGSSAGASASKAKTKSVAVSSAAAAPTSGRLRPATKVTKNVKPVKVATTWSVQTPLAGWERMREIDWPVAGEALGAVSRKTSLDVRRGPSVGEPGLRFAKGKSSTGAVTFLVVQDYGAWLQVAIPVRPNGTVGWVQSSDIQRLNLEFRLVVELSTNTMIVQQGGKELYRESVATGTGNTPTPTGLFFVREVVKESATGPYGPYVFGLSGYSDVLVTFQGGEGAIGIHGTDSPGLIGSNASFGCVRVTNPSIRNLVRLLPLGTPVEIVRKLSDLPSVRRSRGAPDPEPFLDEFVDQLADEVVAAPGDALPEIDINDVPTNNTDSIDPASIEASIGGIGAAVGGAATVGSGTTSSPATSTSSPP